MLTGPPSRGSDNGRVRVTSRDVLVAADSKTYYPPVVLVCVLHLHCVLFPLWRIIIPLLLAFFACIFFVSPFFIYWQGNSKEGRCKYEFFFVWEKNKSEISSTYNFWTLRRNSQENKTVSSWTWQANILFAPCGVYDRTLPSYFNFTM